jgi:hypothetical protein
MQHVGFPGGPLPQYGRIYLLVAKLRVSGGRKGRKGEKRRERGDEDTECYAHRSERPQSERQLHLCSSTCTGDIQWRKVAVKRRFLSMRHICLGHIIKITVK